MSRVSDALSRGVLPAAALRERLDVSPATLMRMVGDAGHDVIRIGRGRATQYALRQPWRNLDAATALRGHGRLSHQDAQRLRWLDAFGALIGNTDRHQYNVLFFADGSLLRLAPAFDHVSMLYSPTPDGQVPPRVFAVPPITPETLDVWDDARDAARESWARGSDDARLSDDGRSLCGSNAQRLAGN